MSISVTMFYASKRVPPTGHHEHCAHREQGEAHQGDDTLEKDLKLLDIELATQVVHKSVDLAQAKHTEGCHVLRGLHRLPW